MDDEALTLAYLAGAMDADGFFTMSRKTIRGSTTYSEFIGLAQVDRTVPDMLQSRFGGYIQVRKRKGEQAENWRPLYYWGGTCRNAAAAVVALRPYLRIKARQADVLIALRASKSLPASERRSVPVGIRSRATNPEVVAARSDLYAEIRALNHNGVAA